MDLKMVDKNKQIKKDNDNLVAVFIAFSIVFDAIKKYKRIRYVFLGIVLFLLSIIIVVGLIISCDWIKDNTTKLFFLAGLGWLLAYWITKNKEWSQRNFEVKQSSYATFISKMLDQNITKTELEPVTAITCLTASDNVRESIETYLSIYDVKDYQNKDLTNMRKEILSKMRYDLLLTNFDIIDCFLYIYKEKQVKSKTPNHKKLN